MNATELALNLQLAHATDPEAAIALLEQVTLSSVTVCRLALPGEWVLAQIPRDAVRAVWAIEHCGDPATLRTIAATPHLRSALRDALLRNPQLPADVAESLRAQTPVNSRPERTPHDQATARLRRFIKSSGVPSLARYQQVVDDLLVLAAVGDTSLVAPALTHLLDTQTLVALCEMLRVAMLPDYSSAQSVLYEMLGITPDQAMARVDLLPVHLRATVYKEYVDALRALPPETVPRARLTARHLNVVLRDDRVSDPVPQDHLVWMEPEAAAHIVENHRSVGYPLLSLPQLTASQRTAVLDHLFRTKSHVLGGWRVASDPRNRSVTRELFDRVVWHLRYDFIPTPACDTLVRAWLDYGLAVEEWLRALGEMNPINSATVAMELLSQRSHPNAPTIDAVIGALVSDVRAEGTLHHVSPYLTTADDEVLEVLLREIPGLAAHALSSVPTMVSAPGAVVLEQIRQRGLPVDLVVRLLIEQPSAPLSAVLAAAADLVRADA